MSDGRLCVFGEVLFDHFPDGSRVLGGAPFNVAWHLQAFGLQPHFISCVGNDAEGVEVRAAMQRWGMDLDGLGTDPQRPTGRVEVRFDDGEPSYEIVCPAAWDAITTEPTAPPCRLLYHGSLALRQPISRASLETLRVQHPQTVFVDVNLRPPWWQRADLKAVLHGAHWVKLNIDELVKLQPSGGSDADNAAAFLTAYGLHGLILTHGSQGAEVLTSDGNRCLVTPERDIDVVDTVGAGDAFASVVILGIIKDWTLDLMLQRAQAFASALVGRRGATVHEQGFYREFLSQWNVGN